MDIIKLLLERLLSWPIVTLLALLVFRKALAALLNRIHTLKAGKEGFTIDASVAATTIQAEAKAETGLKTSEAEQRLKVVKSVSVSPSVQQREEWIRADLQKMNLEANQQETVDLLIRHLAVTQALHTNERIYRTIFGSQIVALKFLNTSLTRTRAQLEQIYEGAKSTFPELYAEYSFQQWVNYLLSNRLIATDDQEHFHITNDGREFLKWMTDAGVSENKRF